MIVIEFRGGFRDDKNAESSLRWNGFPAFDIASLAVDTHISDLAAEHDHYLYGSPKRDNRGR